MKAEVKLQQALGKVRGEQNRVGTRDDVGDLPTEEAAEPAFIFLGDTQGGFGLVGNVPGRVEGSMVVVDTDVGGDAIVVGNGGVLTGGFAFKRH